eukprot:gb/GECH01009598.1/.p1 GENE.gb/GECH01009598.1/~~gb/GECH01009598.1/.p1  ORF type:complete len:238 (+),score=57.63 gb/GECH01009598.1/:1-714(+)
MDDDTNYKLSLEEIVDHSVTLMIAGHETTAISVTWALHYLSLDPELQDRIADQVIEQKKKKHGHGEHDDNGSGNNQDKEDNQLWVPSWDDIVQCPLIDAAFHESLRIMPPIPLCSLILEKEIEVGGFTLPKDTPVMNCIFGIHRDPKYWPHPSKFDPYRFLSPRKEKIVKGSFEPFSRGARNCIGQQFARMEGKMMLGSLLCNYRFHPASSHVKGIRALTLRPEPSFRLHVSPRYSH